jgi:hypothetical protein
MLSLRGGQILHLLDPDADGAEVSAGNYWQPNPDELSSDAT